MTRRRSHHHGPTSVLLVFGGLALLAMLMLFGWQTILFVNWLYPQEDIIFKGLTFACFDVCAFLWTCIATFARLEDARAKTVAWCGAGADFFLSLCATVLYLTILGVFRFHLVIAEWMVDAGAVLSIVALVGNGVLFATFFAYELPARNAYKVQHARYVRRKTRVTTQGNAQVTLGNTSNVTSLPSPVSSNGNAPLTRAQIQKRYRNRQKGQFLP